MPLSIRRQGRFIEEIESEMTVVTEGVNLGNDLRTWREVKVLAGLIKLYLGVDGAQWHLQKLKFR